jgi:hydroxyacylglutathione hydrolase
MADTFNDKNISIEKLQLGPWGTNTYIVVCKHTRDSLVVDAPGEPDKVISRLKSTSPRFILLTHDHMDHIGALDELRSNLNVPLVAHAADSSKLSSPPEMLMNDGDTITLGDLELSVIHTPGHTPGGLCLLTGRHLFSGDTLFPGGPGKTWSPGAFRQIMDSISRKLLVLPDDTLVYPGHGETTVLSREKEEITAFNSRTHDPELCGDVLWLTS